MNDLLTGLAILSGVLFFLWVMGTRDDSDEALEGEQREW